MAVASHQKLRLRRCEFNPPDVESLELEVGWSDHDFACPGACPAEYGACASQALSQAVHATWRR